MVQEAALAQTEHGLAPAGPGWFVLNARDARWLHRPGRGDRVAFTGETDEDVEHFPQVGVNLFVLGPGEPIGIYHREADQEDFLVLYGEALLLVEGQERPLRRWDFVHFPPGTEHMVVGAGDGPCGILAIGARENQEGDGWGMYTVDEVALRHGVGVEEETPDAEVAYARFPDPKPTPYRDGWLPS